MMEICTKPIHKPICDKVPIESLNLKIMSNKISRQPIMTFNETRVTGSLVTAKLVRLDKMAITITKMA